MTLNINEGKDRRRNWGVWVSWSLLMSLLRITRFLRRSKGSWGGHQDFRGLFRISKRLKSFKEAVKVSWDFKDFNRRFRMLKRLQGLKESVQPHIMCYLFTQSGSTCILEMDVRVLCIYVWLLLFFDHILFTSCSKAAVINIYTRINSNSKISILNIDGLFVSSSPSPFLYFW